MRTLLLVLSSVLFAGCASSPKPAPSAPALPQTVDAAAIDRYVAGQMQDNGFVGLSVAVLRDGKLVLAKGYGKKSLASGEPVTADTPFAIGSVTKQFTCACILLLAEAGKLAVTNKVSLYYPDLTSAADITLYDLMTHASGYPDYYPLDFVDRRMREAVEPDQILRDYATGPLDFEPGTRWSYSNTGYILLGRVVEKVSGEPFAQFLARRIFTPLGMTHSSFEPTPGNPALAVGYTSFALGDPEPAEYEQQHWAWAAGAIYSTAADLARWDLALAEGRVLQPESFALMTTPRQLTGGRTFDYGCGLDVRRRRNDTILAHGGAVSGFLAKNALIPRTRSAVVVLSNADYTDPGSLEGELLQLLLVESEQMPRVDGPPPKETALALLREMQAGRLERARLGDEFNLYMTDEKVRRASSRLAALGEPESVVVASTHERGGMEVAVIDFAFKTAAARALLYRTPDGKVQEFLLSRP